MSENIEIWKTIPNYEDYQVSSLGNIKSLKYGKERLLKTNYSGKGYLSVHLSKKSKYITIYVHKLVAITFLKHIPNKMELVIDHINGIKTDNRLENLQIITHKENLLKRESRKPIRVD